MPDPLISIRTLPTASLLGLLVGDVAAEALAGRPLADLVHPHARQPKVCETEADYRAVRILGAAKELLTRALAKTVHSGDCLDSPEKVRDLLRLGPRPHHGHVVDRAVHREHPDVAPGKLERAHHEGVGGEDRLRPAERYHRPVAQLRQPGIAEVREEAFPDQARGELAARAVAQLHPLGVVERHRAGEAVEPDSRS